MSGNRGPSAVVVLADQRIVAHQVDVVVDHDDVALRIVRIHAAAGVGDDQQFGAEGPHHADRESDLPLGIALIGVEAALHRHHRQPLQHAADKLAGMADRSGTRKVRNRGVIEGCLGLDLAGHAAEARAKDDSGMGSAAPMAADYIGSLGDLCRLALA